MESLTVYSPLHQKVRVGNKYDGGYVVVDGLGEYDLFLSGGISNDISFEIDFLNRHPSLKCIAFDGTIQKLPVNSLGSRIQFIKKNIGFEETNSVTNLHSYLDSHSNIFIKMDIEGGEYPFLQSVSDQQLQNVKQLVIEFHNSRDMVAIERLANTHWLVHIHANNALGGSGTFHGKTFVPAVYECTYVRKDVYEKLSQNSHSVPDPILDFKNILRMPDVYLNMLPYTTHFVPGQQIYRKQKLWGL